MHPGEVTAEHDAQGVDVRNRRASNIDNPIVPRFSKVPVEFDAHRTAVVNLQIFDKVMVTSARDVDTYKETADAPVANDQPFVTVCADAIRLRSDARRGVVEREATKIHGDII